MCPNQLVEFIQVDTLRIRKVPRTWFSNAINVARNRRGGAGFLGARAHIECKIDWRGLLVHSNKKDPGRHHVRNVIVAQLTMADSYIGNQQVELKCMDTISETMNHMLMIGRPQLYLSLMPGSTHAPVGLALTLLSMQRTMNRYDSYLHDGLRDTTTQNMIGSLYLHIIPLITHCKSM